MKLIVFFAICFVAVGNGQWVIHNQTYVINSTVVQQHPPGFRPNITQYNYPNVRRRLGNDLIVGTPGPYDQLLLQQWFSKPPKWLQIREKIISYPKDFWGVAPTRVITAVHARDLSTTPGGHAAIVAGGVGQRNVTIRLYSDRGRGFNYEVTVYGR